MKDRRARETSEAGRQGDLTARSQGETSSAISTAHASAISAKLNLSLRTVRNHINNVLRELEVHSQIEAVALSFRRGWI